MHFFRFWNFIILSIFLPLSVSFVYYFLRDGSERAQVTNLLGFNKSNIRKIVIDFKFPYYVDIIEDLRRWTDLPNESVVPTAQVMYHWLVEEQPQIACSFNRTTGLECGYVARIVVIEGDSLEYAFKVRGHHTNFENYVGCYETSLSNLDSFENNIYRCMSHCRSFFFGITEGKECFCVNNTQDFNPVDLNLCSRMCQDKQLQFCGGEDYVSVYRRFSDEEDFSSYNPSWECIYQNESCPECPSGRKGPSCETRDCLLNNGDCGEKECQTSILKCTECACPTCNLSIAVCVCKKGFYIDESMNCFDIDECQKYPCLGNMSCVNLQGNYSCDCPIGYYVSDEYYCYDLDDCLNVTCEENEICVDLIANYSCDCDKGYHRTDDSVKCEDIDECTNIPCGNNSFCLNSFGSFTCTCVAGFYETVEHTCADVDECNEVLSCDQVSTDCNNLEGDYECTCKKGFTKGVAKSPKGKCHDFDECLPSRCPDGISCVNSIGSYDCLCPNGTIKRKYANLIECQDIDECIEEGVCDEASSFCLNTFSFYVCVCRLGYVPVDNFTCIIADVKEETDVETPDVLTTKSFEEEFDPYLSYFLALFIFAIAIVVCLYKTYLQFNQSEQSFTVSSDSYLSFKSVD